MVVEHGSGFSWLRRSQISKCIFIPSEHQWGVPAKWTVQSICSLNSGTCTLESTSICMLWKVKHKNQRQPFCLKGCVETWEYVAWDTQNMFIGERQESILICCGFTSYCYYTNWNYLMKWVSMRWIRTVMHCIADLWTNISPNPYSFKRLQRL